MNVITNRPGTGFRVFSLAWEVPRSQEILRNSEAVAKSFAVTKPRRNSFRVASSRNECVVPGLPKHNPGLELANAFSAFCWAGISERFQRSSAGLELANAFSLLLLGWNYPTLSA